MDPISQRLKEMSPADFEKLCFHVLKERHPSGKVRHVEGASGDLGVDTFVGDLENAPTIWQSKAFANGIAKAQKEQIRESLKVAVRSFRPKRWILCLSTDLDIHAHKWFERLTASYASNGVELGLMQGSDIASELTHRKTIRDYFFPDAGLNVNELRSLITRTGESSDEQIAALTFENAAQYIERLKARDARFNYEVVIATDRKASGPTPGAVFSLSSGSTVINAFPRDLEALALDPPKMTFRFEGSGASKLEDFIRTGREQFFSSPEVRLLQTDISFLELQSGCGGLKIGPSSASGVFSTRITFGRPDRVVVYDFMQFRVKRAGQEEVELVSTTKLPFLMSMVLRGDSATFNLVEQSTGASFLAVRKYLDAMVAMDEGREIEVYDIERGKRLFRANIEGDKRVPLVDPGISRLISLGAKVAEVFFPDLAVPDSVGKDDVETLVFLGGLLDGEVAGIDSVTTTMVKDDNWEKLTTDLEQGHRVSLKLVHPGLTRSFGGTLIPTGAFELTMGEVEVRDREAVVQHFRTLSIGSEISVTLEPVGPVRARLLKRCA